jgi:iron complex outermembrane receptor protein
MPFSLETADRIPHHKQLTQEFRAESNTSDALQWIAGVFYFKEHVQIDSITFDTFAGSSLKPDYTTQSQDADSWAAFGTLNYTVSEKLKLRGGVRYTRDKKDFVALRVEAGSIGPQTIHNTSNNVSWDASGTYTVDKNTNLFARIATGYRAPSIQGRLYGPTDVPSMADAEKALSVEAGVKQDLFDRRARLSATVYDYRVKNKQLTAGSGTINMNRQINADKAVGHGVELDLQANLAEGLSMSLGSSYNYTEIQDPNLYVKYCGSPCTVTNPKGPFDGTAWIDGNPLPRAPRWQHNFTLKYSVPVADGELYAYTDWTHRTSYNDFLYAAREYAVKPMTEGGLRVGYKWSRYELAAYGRNITNQVQAQAAIDINNLVGIVNEPRTYGVQFKASF